MVWGKIMPAATSLAKNGLPLGLAHMKLVRPVAKGQLVTWADVEVDPKDPTVAFRREMEKTLRRRSNAGKRGERGGRGTQPREVTMNLHRMLLERAERKGPIRIGLIGAGKFGTMFLAQARLTPGMHILGIADLNVERAREACHRTGWPAEQFAAPSFAAALKSGRDPSHRRRHGPHRGGWAGRGDRGDGRSPGGDQARPRGHRAQAAHHHGLRGGRCSRRPAPRQEGPGGGRGLLPGLRGPARHHLRAGGLGPDLRLPCGLRREGDPVPPVLPRVHPRDRLAALRLDRRNRGQGRAPTPRCSTRSSTAPSPGSR